MRPDRLPRPLRLGVYAAIVAVILFITLAPTEVLPEATLSDKVEHALTWAGLTLLGFALSPRRLGQIAVFALAFGAAIEGLQEAMPFGRTADWLDLVADAVGVAVGVGLATLLRRRVAA